jgi:hypothetical protein
MRIFCCGCGKPVNATLTSGSAIYPRRTDLAALPFWICNACGNYVGCHHKTKDRTKPLGNIPTPELRNARKHIHAILDPIWRSGKMSRADIYRAITQELGYQFHTAEIRTVEDARRVWKILRKLA